MKKIKSLMLFVILIFLISCSHIMDSGTHNESADIQSVLSPGEILQSWHGDYPVLKLDLLPEMQREEAVGYIGLLETFENVWKAFKPGEDVPEIDFKTNIVLFVRNMQFYNRISIGKVTVTDGIAEVLAMETMSAMPIEDKVAMSMVLLSRQGIVAINTGDNIISISNNGN